MMAQLLGDGPSALVPHMLLISHVPCTCLEDATSPPRRGSRAVDDRLGLTARAWARAGGRSPSPAPRPSHHRETPPAHSVMDCPRSPTWSVASTAIRFPPRSVPGQVLRRRFVVGRERRRVRRLASRVGFRTDARDLPDRRRLGEPKTAT
jgi:hypothetical protein